MRNALLILAIFTTSLCFSQDNIQYFEVGKIYYETLGLKKLKANVVISDSVITFDYSNPKTSDQLYKVNKIESTNTHKMYYVNLEGFSDYEGRFILSENDNKKNPYTLLLESKDNFTGNITKIVYFLRKKD